MLLFPLSSLVSGLLSLISRLSSRTLAGALAIRGHALAAQQEGADVVWAGALRRQVPRLDHEIERVIARLHRQQHLLVHARRLVDRVDHLQRLDAVGGLAAEAINVALDPVGQLGGLGRAGLMPLELV